VGVPKGTDNFKAFRAAQQGTSVELLRAELEKARRRKMPYPDKATLVSDMAERTKIHRTTLIRNPLYHRMLLEFLAGQSGASTFVADKDAPPELLRAKLVDAQMELGSLKEQLAARVREHAGNVVRPGAGGPALSESEAHVAYADTVWALRAVIDRVNMDGDVFEVDMDKAEIRDLAAAPGRRVVVSGPRLRPFLDALRRLKEQER
jgi:hypothetical protein